jgi:hypothetical protein
MQLWLKERPLRTGAAVLSRDVSDPTWSCGADDQINWCISIQVLHKVRRVHSFTSNQSLLKKLRGLLVFIFINQSKTNTLSALLHLSSMRGSIPFDVHSTEYSAQVSKITLPCSARSACPRVLADYSSTAEHVGTDERRKSAPVLTAFA